MARRQGGKRRSGDKKHGREKRKAAAKGSAISAFVRGRISAADYWKVAGIKAPQKGA